jgi:hypothetical protein
MVSYLVSHAQITCTNAHPLKKKISDLIIPGLGEFGLVSDIPAGDEKITNHFFYSVVVFTVNGIVKKQMLSDPFVVLATART